MSDILPPIISEHSVRIPRKGGTVRICDQPSKYSFVPKYAQPTHIFYRGINTRPTIFNEKKYTGWRKDAAIAIAKHHNESGKC